MGGTAVVTFDVQVNVGVPPGTIISNQGVVSTNESFDEETDADGIDTNGDQPTQVVVGDAQLLSIVKEVFVVNGGAAVAGSQLEYVIRVNNRKVLNGVMEAIGVLDPSDPEAHAATRGTVLRAIDKLDRLGEDGVRIHAFFLPSPGATRSLLFLHGNAGNASHRLPNAAELAASGAAVMAKQSELTAEKLADILAERLENPALLSEMGSAMKAQGRPEAATTVATWCLEQARG